MNNINSFLKDLSYGSKYQFLDVSNADHQKEIQRIAEKRGIVLPAHDLSIFKCVYAFTDIANKNGCTLPKEEVAKSLETLVGKAIDFDHIRKRVVGYWADAELKDGTIYAWGIFFKGNFGEDYELIKSMLEKDILAISFEAWGVKEFTKDGLYSLNDIEFAGGALLIKTEPAFDGAGVLEMANNKTKVLEFASTLKAPENFFHEGNKKDIENARFFLGDFESIVRMLMESSCPICGTKWLDISAIDFENNFVTSTCMECNSHLHINMTPQPTVASVGRKVVDYILTKINGHVVNDLHKIIAEENIENDDIIEAMIQDFDEEDGKTLTTKDRKGLSDDKFALIQTVKNKKGESKKIRRFPINDENHVRNALARLPQAKNLTSEERDSVMKKIIKRARELNMKDLLEKYDKASVEEQKKMIEDLATANAALTTENASLKTRAEKAEGELTTAKASYDELKVKADADAAEIAKVREAEKAAKLTDRKTKLGEFAKDMKDEDILDDAKYEFATMKMEKAKLEIENAELKKNGGKTVVTMDKGSKDKEAEAETFEIAKKVIEKAYPSKK